MTWGQQNSEAEAHEQLDYYFECGINTLYVELPCVWALDTALFQHPPHAPRPHSDTAELYPVPPKEETQGATDRYIASWLKTTSVKREDMILATKVAGYTSDRAYMRPGADCCRVTPAQIEQSVDASLQRLGVDHIDLLQIHWYAVGVGLYACLFLVPTYTCIIAILIIATTADNHHPHPRFHQHAHLHPHRPDRYVSLFGAGPYDASKERTDDTPFEEQLRGLQNVIDAGKVRHVGVSNETSYGVMRFCVAAEAAGLPKIVSIQNAYSLLVRGAFETDLAEVCAPRQCNVGLLAYSPLAGGALSGKV